MVKFNNRKLSLSSSQCPLDMIQASAFFSFAKIDLIHILGCILALSLYVCAYIPNSHNPSPTPRLRSQPT